MQIERVDAAQLERLGGPTAVASHLRSLVPGGESVELLVREIIDRVRAEGEEAVIDYTRRFDTAGEEPGPLVVTPEELDEAIRRLPLELVAGLQVAIKNVALVAQAGVSDDVAIDLPQGQRIVLREVPVARPPCMCRAGVRPTRARS